MSAGHVQVLIDGQPVYSGLAGVYGLDQVPAGNIERIEIVKGAGSALYGSSAIAGVINIITKKPGKKPEITLTTEFGAHNRNRYSMEASFKSGNRDVILTAQKNTSDAINEEDKNDAEDLPAVYTDAVKADDVATGVRINWYDLSGNDQLNFNGRTLNELRVGGNLTDDSYENPFSASAENIATQRYEAGIGYSKTFDNDSMFSTNLSFAQHHRSATNDSFLSDYEGIHGTVPPVNEMKPYIADEQLYVSDINYAYPLLKSHRFLTGVQYSYNRLEESGKYCIVDNTDPDYGKTYLSESEKHADEIGLYLQDEVSLRDNLELVVGGRYDIHKSKDSFGGSGDIKFAKEKIELEYDENAFNPRAALKYKPSSNVVLRTSVGTGFRVPYGFSEDLHLCSGSPRVYKGVDLRPEKSISTNFGVDYNAEKYGLNISVFRTTLRDKIDFGDAGNAAKALNYTYQWQNVGDAYTQGMEFGSRFTPVSDIDLDFNLSYTDAQYDDERQDWVVNHPEFADESKYIPRVPSITGGIKLDYNPGDWKMILDNI
ncbi:MAG: TonB-dependent receptor [Elusimicrobiota bacterium]